MGLTREYNKKKFPMNCG